MKAFQIYEPRGKLRRYNRILRHTELFGVERRSVRRGSNRLSKARRTENQNGLVCFRRNHRLMGCVRLQRKVLRAVRLRENVIRHRQKLLKRKLRRGEFSLLRPRSHADALRFFQCPADFRFRSIRQARQVLRRQNMRRGTHNHTRRLRKLARQRI